MNYEQMLADIDLQQGGLVEIYVLNATLQDWKQSIEHFANEGYITQFTESGAVAEVHVDTTIFGSPDGPTYTMSLDVDGQIWTTAFLSEDAIDLQGSPEQIKTSDDLQIVLKLMSELRRITGKRVIFVPETMDVVGTDPYLVVDSG